MEKPSPIRKFMEKTAKRKTFYISDVFAVFWLLLFLLVRPTWPEVVAFFHLIAFFLLLPPDLYVHIISFIKFSLPNISSIIIFT